jgi:hypothetical protein
MGQLPWCKSGKKCSDRPCEAEGIDSTANVTNFFIGNRLWQKMVFQIALEVGELKSLTVPKRGNYTKERWFFSGGRGSFDVVFVRFLF